MSPAFESTADDELKSGIRGILNDVSLTEKLAQIEDENESKMGPRSIAKPWGDRRSSLEEYFHHAEAEETDHEDDPIFRDLRPSSADQAISRLISTSSSGLPYMRRKGAIRDSLAGDWYGQLGIYPCVLYTRTQEQEKTRNVWGYPVAETIAEQRFLGPFLERERSLEWRSALRGPDEVDLAINALLKRRGATQVVFCADFSAYDASVSPTLSLRALGLVGRSFQSGGGDDWRHIERQFTAIPIWTPDGQFSGHHGVPSGSSFTNTVDSLVQWILAGKPADCQIQGDDGVYLVEDVDKAKSHFTDSGLLINEEKTDVFKNTECVYLQRYYHPEYQSIDQAGMGGVYSLMRAMTRIKYLETWTDFEREGITGSDFFSLRTIMILENCKHHPGFAPFVRFIAQHDREGLKFTSEGLKAFSKTLESQARAGVLHSQDPLTGIGKFQTMKVLKTL